MPFFLLISLYKRQGHLSPFSPGVSSNKPSGASKHEGLKWYTVWKLSIQLLMSKIWDPEAKTVIFFQRTRERKRHWARVRWRRERKKDWDGREKGVIIRFPCWDVPSLVCATYNWGNSFTGIEQCLPNVLLANPPLYSLLTACMSLGSGQTLGHGGSTSSPCAMSYLGSLCNYFTF